MILFFHAYSMGDFFALYLCKSIWFFSFDFISTWAKVVAVAVRGLGNFFGCSWMTKQCRSSLICTLDDDLTSGHLEYKPALVSLSAIILACTISNLLTLEYWFLLLLSYFSLMNALVYVDIAQGIHKGKNESCSKWKTKKTTFVFFLYKYRKFWSVSLEFKLECKTFILEVCEEKNQMPRHLLLLYFNPLELPNY